jgi:hypothetical protein
MVLPSRSDVLEVVSVSDREWCVYDHRLPLPDSARQLAYISRLNDSRFMVTGLDGERGWMLFHDYDSALDTICARCLDRTERRRRSAA